MKTNFLKIAVIVFLIFTSCSDQTESKLEIESVDSELYRVTATHKNITAKQESLSGDVLIFNDNKLEQKFIYLDQEDKNTEDIIVEYLDNNSIRITNANNTKQFIDVLDVLSTGTSIDLGIETSEGLFLDNVHIQMSENVESKMQQRCPPCIIIGIAGAVDIILAIVDASAESDCAVAINACTGAGGLPSTTITQGFFGTNCSVQCQEPQN